MPSPPPANIGEDQQPLKSDKEAKAVFLPEERSPRLSWQEKLAKRLKVRNEYTRLVLAEFLGTYVLVALGCGAIAQEVVSRGTNGNIVTIMFGWGLAVAMGVYMCGGASGGHINPAFSTAMVLLGRLPLRKLPFYWIGQYLGAFCGAFSVWIIYFDGLKNIDGGTRHSKGNNETDPLNTDGIFGTFPNPNMSVGQCFADQIFGTMLLVLIAMAVTDKRNMNVPHGLVPVVIGLGVTGILTGYVHNCGAALNPARDLGPRIFTAIAGWSSGPFAVRNYTWWWVPIMGPHIGAIVGALFYNICVGLHWPEPVDARYA